ncbi:MAG: VOC family protein [Solirubrobacteraceae bacterium]|nr:VOC family protein [Solirubrobacteraceae bacterium]
MPSAANWFQIPASDITRAKKFYETICGFSLEQLEMPSNMEMWAFPADRRKGEVGGALVCGEGAVASATGTMVFLNGDPDLQGMLDRVEGAGGRIIAAKTAIGMDAGYFAIITDSEGNTVGLHSQG